MGLLGLISLMACGEEPTPEDAAMASAQQSYESLLEGDYESFLAGRADAEQMPASYREQLVANMKMFADQMQQEHHGMKEVRIVNCTADTARHSANVFLVICFGDSTIEETVVPMVENQGRWLMK